MLVSYGIVFDTISELGLVPRENESFTTPEELIGYAQDVSHFLGQGKFPACYEGNPSENIALLTIIHAQPSRDSSYKDQISDRLQSATSIMSAVAVGEDLWGILQEELDWYNNFTILCEKSLRTRRLGRTSKGYIGAFPPSAQIGDVVAVLSEVKYPMLLRETEKMHENEICHQIIGDCFVYGIMRKDMFANGDCRELGDVRPFYLV